MTAEQSKLREQRIQQEVRRHEELTQLGVPLRDSGGALIPIEQRESMRDTFQSLADEETLIQSMRRERKVKGSPVARTVQRAGDYLGNVPPYGVPGLIAQTAGDAVFTGASAYLASQGAAGATEEAIGGLIALLSPVPKALIKAQQSNEIRDALVDFGVSQAAQETGQVIGQSKQEKALKGQK